MEYYGKPKKKEFGSPYKGRWFSISWGIPLSSPYLERESLYLLLTWRGNPFIQFLPGEGIPLSSSYLERESLVYPSKQFIFVWSFYEEVGLTLYSQLSNWYMTRDLETYILVQQLCTRKLKSVISFHSKFPVCASNVLPKKKMRLATI